MHPTEQVSTAQAIAFRLFLVVLLACTIVPLTMLAAESLDQAHAASAAKERQESWTYFYESCEKAKAIVGDGGVCAQARQASEDAELLLRLEGQHSAKAELLFRVVLFLPPLVVLCFYTGRWAITGRLRPLWSLRAQSETNASS
jgi:hypothetical protein